MVDVRSEPLEILLPSFIIYQWNLKQGHLKREYGERDGVLKARNKIVPTKAKNE